MSVKELKFALKERGVSLDGLAEKQDLVDALEQSIAAAQLRSSLFHETTQENTVSELRDLIRHFAGRSTGCLEKSDLIKRAKLLINERKAGCCPICLDSLLDDDREMLSTSLLVESSNHHFTSHV